jgi:hypothetical protein
MKSLLTFFVLVISVSLSLEAQTIIGFGGNINTSTSTSSDQSIMKPISLGVNLYPRIGYLFNNKFSVGVGYGWGNSQTTYEKTAYTSQTIYKSNNWFISPFLRLYFAGNKKVSLIFDFSARYGGSTSSTKVGNNSAQNRKSYLLEGFYIEPALAYNVSDKFSLEMSIGNFRYSTTKEKTSEVTTSGYYYSLGLESITGRLIFKLGGKKAPKQTTLDKYN